MIVSWLVVGALAAEPTLEELLVATDDAQRGQSSIAVISMQVKTANYERTMKMQAWSKGTEQTLVKILEPAKDAGVATLKVGENLWNYLPKVDRTMKVPAGMMSGSWMGSHFSNDDLVKDSRLSDDFDCAFQGKPADAGSGGNYTIACTPHPDAPVVWGKVVAVINPERVPVKVDFFDEKAVLVRTMEYSDIKVVGGKKTATTMLLLPRDKPGEFTKMTFESLEIDSPVDDALFSLQALKP
ncbi:MAG: outer membrane lipoprotein-sorting protein [Myxococcota bacterium]